MQTIQQAAGARKHHPIRVLQFGEGNFLRAFVDEMIQQANDRGLFDGGIAIVKPKAGGSLERFQKQDLLYTVLKRGKQDGAVVHQAELVTCVEKVIHCHEEHKAFLELAGCDTLEFVISNTTEAGIVLDLTDSMEEVPATFPGKLTKFLYARYRAFSGDPSKGLTLLPTELIEDNGQKLRQCVLSLAGQWKLPEDFTRWVKTSCRFCSTLVDRIVTGKPADAEAIWEELGWKDELLDVAEPFGLWVIEGGTDISARFPLQQAGMPVRFVSDLTPYRQQKVRILNGAHTSTVLLGWLAGLDIVRQCMEDTDVRAYLEKAMNEEILPFVPLPAEQSRDFADAVFERFENPFLQHRLLDISLNSFSKWKARVLPSFRDYYAAHGVIAPALTLSFAGLLAFYTSDTPAETGLAAVRPEGTAYVIRDDAAVLELCRSLSTGSAADYVRTAAARTDLWGEDLSLYPGFCGAVTAGLEKIRRDGARAAIRSLLKGE